MPIVSAATGSGRAEAPPAEEKVPDEKAEKAARGKKKKEKTYTLTKDNLQAIRDILNAYDTLLGSDVSTARVVLRSLVK